MAERIEGMEADGAPDGQGPRHGTGDFADHIVAYRVARTADPVHMAEIQRPAAGTFTDRAADALILARATVGGFTAVVEQGGSCFRHRFAEGDIGVTPPGMAVTVTTDGPSAFQAVALPPQTLERLVSRSGGAGVRPDLDRLKGGILRNALIDSLCRRLWQEAELDGPLSRLASDGALMLIVAELLREAGPAVTPARGGLAPWQVNRAKDFMRADLSRDTPVSDLAGLLGLSVHHFCRMFKLSTGLSPHQWLIAQRMDRARHLLMEPDRSLGEVARAVGYANATAFATAFRRVTGTTPSDWRRQSGLR